MTLAKQLLISLIALTVLSGCASPGKAHAKGQTQVESDFSRAELDQMLAPIALYPDTVLSHMLIASTYPLEVVQADRWVRNNSNLDAQEAVAAAEKNDWDPSVQALAAFPEILERMSENLDWTQRVGDAFLADEVAVMDAIQELRQKAYASGSLNEMEHVRVQREEKVIVIEPAVERVVYIPYYDTRTVYGGWWWADYPPIHWHYPRRQVHVNGFYYGPRVHVGAAFYFSSFHWLQRRVVYIDRKRYPRPRVYSSTGIARYHGARHWRHNPAHRRGVVYRNHRVREHYSNTRERHHIGRRQSDANVIRRSTDPSARRRSAERVRERLSTGNDGSSRTWRGAGQRRGDHRATTEGRSRPEGSVDRFRTRQTDSTAPSGRVTDSERREKARAQRDDRAASGTTPARERSEGQTRNRSDSDRGERRRRSHGSREQQAEQTRRQATPVPQRETRERRGRSEARTNRRLESQQRPQRAERSHSRGNRERGGGGRDSRRSRGD